jgi:single stranded DNA-binding protein
MLNSCDFQGRFAADPELRTTQTGKQVASFRMAVDRDMVDANGHRPTDWLTFTAWGKTAEFVSKYFRKGSAAVVHSRCQTRQYEDMQAIQMTIPNFRLSKIEDYLYTLDEMKLVNQIGNAYSLAGDNEKAADIFYRLLQYMRCHLQEMVTSNRMLPLVLYNFARSLDLLERYEESARVARNGKEACIKYGHYQVLHSCLEIEAECDFFLGKKEESAERYREAFYICKVMRYEDDLQIIRNEAQKYLDIIF